VKNKMSKSDFLRLSSGAINGDGDLAPEFMEALYDRIIHNEIKMRDGDPLGGAGGCDGVGELQVAVPL
jgi:Sec7-like guanine-nucleotide exchange factor